MTNRSRLRTPDRRAPLAVAGIAQGRVASAVGRAIFTIANTGPVIPTGELARLFQPFQRLTSDPRPSADGVGLGLAIVQAIASAHGATVTAQPRIGGGLGIDVAFHALD
jgi:signal transduction histidine kinase